MEPQTAPTPEQGSKPARQPEQAPIPEQSETLEPSQERSAPKGETAGQSAPTIPPVSLPKPVVADDSGQVPASRPKTVERRDMGPAVADDVDVMEKEWVDRAKSIVSEHKHDPYNQEKEVSKLSADYIKKRTGKDVKLSP